MRPDSLAQEIIQTAFPDAVVEVDKISRSALYERRYAFVQVLSGTAAHPGRLHTPLVEVVTYGHGTHEEVQDFSNAVMQALYDAWFAGSETSQGYLARFRVSIMPYAQDIPGLPNHVHRFSAQYQLGIRPLRA